MNPAEINLPVAFLSFVIVVGIALAVIANGTSDGTDA